MKSVINKQNRADHRRAPENAKDILPDLVGPCGNGWRSYGRHTNGDRVKSQNQFCWPVSGQLRFAVGSTVMTTGWAEKKASTGLFPAIDLQLDSKMSRFFLSALGEESLL